jgi:hypothetical protein
MTATTMWSRRVAGTALAVLLVVASGLLAGAAPASAASYRYWTYWQGTAGAWTFATAGPASLIPQDGSVEGWRFAVTSQSGGASDAPRAAPSFKDICGTVTPAAGNKAVALVVDPGPAQTAPDGQIPPPVLSTCVEIAADATGYQVLRSVVEVRTEKGLVCGVGGYPTGECAPAVELPSAGSVALAPTGPTATPSTAEPLASTALPKDAGTPWATIGVAAVIALGAGLVLWRRRA